MPGDELFRQSWPRRLDLALLVILMTFAGLMNAFAMTPPVYALEQWLAGRLGTQQEWIVLGLLFLVAVGIVPLLLVYGSAWLNRRFLPTGDGSTLSRQVIRFAVSFVPLGFGIWGAHYLFHLLIGPLTIVPAAQNFFVEVFGVPVLGMPNWQIAALWIPSLGIVQAI